MRQRLARTAALLCLLAGLLAGTDVRANGWEHGAIPLEALLGALESPSASIRARAAQSLGIRAEDGTGQYLVNLLNLPELDPGVRSAAYLALGAMRYHGGAPVLARCLREETRDELRADCLTALGRIASPMVFLNVLDETGEDRSILVRSAAVDALSGYADERAIARLVDIARDPANLPLGNRAIVSLGKAGDASVVPVLLDLLDATEDPFRQKLIARALGTLHASDALPALEGLATGSEDHTVRTEAAFALGTIREGSALSALLEALEDPHPAVVFTALRSIFDLGERTAARPVAALARTLRTRISAHDADAMRADFVAVYADMSVEVEALRVLSALNAQAGTPVLLEAARAEPLDTLHASIRLRIAEAVYERRRVAIYGLGYTDSDEARTLLAGADGIGDADPRLRAAAARALGVLGGGQAAERVAPLLEDENRDVRIMAARVVGRLGDRRRIQALAPLLDDTMAGVRAEAALSLGYLKARGTSDRLAALAANDPDKTVREAAAYALQLIGKE